MLVYRLPAHWCPKPGPAGARARRIVHSSDSDSDDLPADTRTRTNNADTTVIEITDSSDEDDECWLKPTSPPTPARLPCQSQTNKHVNPLPASDDGLLVLYVRSVFATYVSDTFGAATVTNLKAHENRCVVHRHLEARATRLRPASCKRFRHCRRSPNQTRKTRVLFSTNPPRLFRLSFAFPPVPLLLPPLPRKRPRERRPNPPRPPLPLKHLARPKRRWHLRSRQNVRHTHSRSLMTLIGRYLVVVSRRQQLWSGATVYLPLLVGLDGNGGLLDYLLPCLTLNIDNVCIRRSKEGVQTTSIELAIKILDSNGESLYEIGERLF